MTELTMPFGKHKGKPLSLVPVEYLKWMIRDHVGGRALISEARRIVHGTRTPGTPHSSPSKGISGERKRTNELPKFDCRDRFRPDWDWPGRQEWDGESAPWEEQSVDVVDPEFKSMFQ